MDTMCDKKESINKLKKAIMDADFDGAPKITREALAAGVEPDVLMEKAIGEAIRGLEEKLFGGHKVWMHPVFFMAMEAARRSLEILEPWFKIEIIDNLSISQIDRQVIYEGNARRVLKLDSDKYETRM